MIKNYIFDFGNVLANFVPEDMTGKYIEDKEIVKTVSQVVFDRIYWDKLDNGTITDEEIKADFSNRLPEDLAKAAKLVYDNWINCITPIDGMRELICDIKNSGKKLYLLSNISIGFADGYKNVSWINELFSYFDGLVFSGKIGMIKPDRNIFEYLLNKYELFGEECLFIDDSHINIDGAKKAGINGYLFDGNSEKLREFIGL